MLKTHLILVSGLFVTSIVLAEQNAADLQQQTIDNTTQQVSETPASVTPAEDKPVTTTAMPEVMEEQSGFSRGSVMRSVFTNGIEDREPVDNMQAVGNHGNSITYFTELRDMSGQTAKHRWEYNGNVMAEVEFNVRGPRWRVWSSKSLMPQWEGEWKVSVVNAAGDVIAEEVIDYKTVDESAMPADKAADMMESSPPQMENVQQQ